MQYVENWQQLKALINGLLAECLREIAEETKNQLKEFVDTVWYQSYSPQFYERTYQLLNSIVRSEVENKGGDKFNVIVFFDTEQIIPNFMENNFWNQHMGFDGQPFTEGLVEVIENGNPSPYYTHSGIHMFSEVSKWLESNILKISAKVFNRYGINVFFK